MENVYNIIEKNIRIKTIYPFFHEVSKSYLSKENKYDFVIEITNEDIELEKQIQKENFKDEEYEFTAILRKLMNVLSPLNYFLIHGSAVAIDNKAYLFIAPSGTGKTTHTNHYLNIFTKRAEIINGDKPILKIDDGVCYLYGTPWSGKERQSINKKVPLKAIISLNRGEDNKIKEMSYLDIFPSLIGQTYESNKKDTLTFLDELAKVVRFYHLECTKDIESAKVSYKGMNNKLSFEDIIDLDGTLIFPSIGYSMYPLIKENHDILIIDKIKEPLKKYDVVLFKRENGNYVLHRILGKNKKGYIISGDNQYRREFNVKENQIIGILSKIDKGNKIITMNDEDYLKYVHKTCDHFYLRAIKLFFKTKFKKK